MISISSPSDSLRRQWRQQIAAHLDPRSVAARRGFVALTFADRSNSSSTFVDIDQLSVILLYEDEAYMFDRAPLRFCCYGVRRVPHGVLWGGAEENRLFKDLTLAPKWGAHGPRLDIRKQELLALALKLDRRLSRAARYPAAFRSGLRLPLLWAGFRSLVAHDLRGEGPEFEVACRTKNVKAAELFANTARRLDGLTLYPLDWVSGQLERAAAVFAEMTVRVRRQVIRVSSLMDGLISFDGASAYDFYNSRFRANNCRRARRSHSTQWMRRATRVKRRSRVVAVYAANVRA